MKSSRAFSLVEVVLALGVAAVAFTAIMGLFPLGLDMSRETHEETQAALIAQSIFGDLRDSLAGGTNRTNRRVLFTSQISLSNGMTNFAIGTNAPTNVLYLGFSNHPISAANNPEEPGGVGALVLRPGVVAAATTTNAASAPLWFQNGSNGLVAVARVVATSSFRLANPDVPEITSLDIMVETPGNIAATNRAQHGFRGGFR